MSLMAASVAVAQQQSSPNGNVVLTFSLTAEGTPAYKVTYKNKPVVKESTLGVSLKKAEPTTTVNEPLTKNFRVIGEQKSTFKETWRPVWGEESEILNHYNELLVSLRQEGTNRLMNIRTYLFCSGRRAYAICDGRRPYGLVDSG